MKKRNRGLRLCIALMLVLSLIVPQFVFAADMDKPLASNVRYYNGKDGKKAGIQNFSIGRFHYYNISRDKNINPDGSETLVINNAKLRDIAINDIFPRWSMVARDIFRDQADQLVTIEGSGMMSSDEEASNSFDRQFNYVNTTYGYNNYKQYDWSVKDLAELLSRKSSLHEGEQNWDEKRATGITSIGSLNDARTLVGQELRNCSDDNDNTVDDFLANKKDKTANEYRLPDLADSKSGSGFASVVTCVNRAGSSGDYDYVSFGLAVYDFDVSPIAAKDLDYVTAADKSDEVKAIIDGTKGNRGWDNAKGVSFEEYERDAKETVFVNSSKGDSSVETQLEKSSSVQNSLTTENSFEWGMRQHVGTKLQLGDTEKHFSRYTFEFSNEWSELWKTVNGKSESQTDTQKKTASSSITLPAHTTATVVQNATEINVKERYQQPVVLNYKVAIFAMSGDYFNGWAGGISPSRYDKQWMSVIFDGSDQEDKPGCDAIGSLFNRAFANRDTQGYDGATGKFKSWCDKSAWTKSTDIDWGQIDEKVNEQNEDVNAHKVTSMISGGYCDLGKLAGELPMIEQGFIMNTKKEVMISDLKHKIPLYDLARVDLKDSSKRRCRMNAGDTLYLEEIGVKGYDSDNVDYYGFDQAWGEWQLLDRNMKPITDGSTSDEDKESGRIGFGNFTLVNDEYLGIQYVEAGDSAEGSKGAYLQWTIKPDAHIISNDTQVAYSKGRRNVAWMNAEELSRIQTPRMQVYMNSTQPAGRSGNISNLGADTYTGYESQKINLNNVFDISATAADSSDSFPIYWEAKSDEGTILSKDGSCTLTKEGEYQVRAFSPNSEGEPDADGTAYSDWLTIEVKKEPVLTYVSIDQKKLDELDKELVISKDNPTVSLDIAKFLTYRDQYGDVMEPDVYDESNGKWKHLIDDTALSVEGDETAYIGANGMFTASKPGSYTVYGEAWDESGKTFSIPEAEIKVGGDKYISSIVFDRSAMAPYTDQKLRSVGDVAVIKDLDSKILYLDQNGDPWTGAKPEVEFSAESGGSDAPGCEIKGGDLYISRIGLFNLWLVSENKLTDRIEISAEDGSDKFDPANLVISARDAEPVLLNKDGSETDIDIERLVEYRTKLGGKWDGKRPELVFTLGKASAKAKLEEHTKTDEREGTGNYKYTAFVTKTPGSYRIHVAAADPARYSGEIKDITLNVAKSLKQSLKAKAKTKKISFKKLAKKKQTVSAIKVTGNKGRLTYKKLSVSKKKYAKRFSVNAKTGRITVKKGTPKGLYKIKVKVRAAKKGDYAAAAKTVTVKIRVK